ncbi:MAG: methyltransferase [Oscillospiraceae bacterium]|nr:methyltransferase [Oscillospiraceae bacterium]
MSRWESLEPYTLRLEEDVFPLTGDALALGAFATVRGGWQVCDLGCGSGALLVLAARRAMGLTLIGVDTLEAAVRLTGENLRENGLAGQAVLGNVRTGEGLPEAGRFQLVLCNPPYFPKGGGRSGGNARMEESASLEDFAAAAGRLLQNGGRFALCHRTDRLTDVLCALRNANLEPKRLKLRPPLLLVEAVKNARPGGLIVEGDGV